MTSNVPTEDHAPYSGRGWSSMLPPSEANLFNRGLLHLGILIQETTQVLVDGYNGIQTAMTRYAHHAASGTATPAESVNLESQPGNHFIQQQDMVSVGRPDTTPGDTYHNHTNPFTREVDDMEVTGHLPTRTVDHTNDTALPQSKARGSWTWVMKLTFVLLLLIMAPGLIVGIVTRQVSWGIAISGAFAPAIVFFRGLYCHHNM